MNFTYVVWKNCTVDPLGAYNPRRDGYRCGAIMEHKVRGAIQPPSCMAAQALAHAKADIDTKGFHLVDGDVVTLTPTGKDASALLFGGERAYVFNQGKERTVWESAVDWNPKATPMPGTFSCFDWDNWRKKFQENLETLGEIPHERQKAYARQLRHIQLLVNNTLGIPTNKYNLQIIIDLDGDKEQEFLGQLNEILDWWGPGFTLNAKRL